MNNTKTRVDPYEEQRTPAFEHGLWWGMGLTLLVELVFYCLIFAPLMGW